MGVASVRREDGDDALRSGSHICTEKTQVGVGGEGEGNAGIGWEGGGMGMGIVSATASETVPIQQQVSGVQLGLFGMQQTLRYHLEEERGFEPGATMGIDGEENGCRTR